MIQLTKRRPASEKKHEIDSGNFDDHFGKLPMEKTRRLQIASNNAYTQEKHLTCLVDVRCHVLCTNDRNRQ